jgi:hypothetical protein
LLSGGEVRIVREDENYVELDGGGLGYPALAGEKSSQIRQDV